MAAFSFSYLTDPVLEFRAVGQQLVFSAARAAGLVRRASPAPAAPGSQDLLCLALPLPEYCGCPARGAEAKLLCPAPQSWGRWPLSRLVGSLPWQENFFYMGSSLLLLGGWDGASSSAASVITFRFIPPPPSCFAQVS